MDFGLKEKVVVVTGASGAIGSAIARAFSREGARLVLGFHSGREAAQQLAEQIEQDGGEVLPVKLDLGDRTSILDGLRQASARWRGLDVLVACAWVSPGWSPPDTPTESIPAEAWNDQMCKNVNGTAYAVQAVLPSMRASGWGRIVLISSGAAEDGSPGMEPYGSAKAALLGLNKGLARSLGPAGILTNVVLPGFVPTPRHRRSMPAQVIAGLAAATPSRRLTTEEDVARLVVFLGSAANGNITGTAARISGGMHF
jgi:NAD(P)-dependent dehydrogenase (short-subunit alcohol dehydrogenase family)